MDVRTRAFALRSAPADVRAPIEESLPKDRAARGLVRGAVVEGHHPFVLRSVREAPSYPIADLPAGRAALCEDACAASSAGRSVCGCGWAPLTLDECKLPGISPVDRGTLYKTGFGDYGLEGNFTHP